MKFSNYLNPKYVFTDIKANTKEEVIEEIVNRLMDKNPIHVSRKEEILNSILKREKEISTAMGNGVFLPHARIKDFNDFILAIAVLKNPVRAEIGATKEYDDIKFVFLIICDVLKNKNILRSMSVISKIGLRHLDVLEKIYNEDNPNEIINLLKIEDAEVEHRIVAEDVLSPDVLAVKITDTLEEVAKRLILERISGLPVVSDEGYFLGEITEKELIEFGLPGHLSLFKDINFLTVGEPFEEYLMNETTATIENIYRKDSANMTIDKKTPILEICFKMVTTGRHRLYVVEQGKYFGMINRSDIIKKVLHI